jgi:hypothetical protein
VRIKSHLSKAIICSQLPAPPKKKLKNFSTCKDDNTEVGYLKLSENQKLKKKPPPIWAPITLVTCAYILGLLYAFDLEVERAIFTITESPDLLIDYFGTVFPILLGLIHLAISQFFKSKRNSYSRRYIIIYWSIAAIVVLLLAFPSKGFI